MKSNPSKLQKIPDPDSIATKAINSIIDMAADCDSRRVRIKEVVLTASLVKAMAAEMSCKIDCETSCKKSHDNQIFGIPIRIIPDTILMNVDPGMGGGYNQVKVAPDGKVVRTWKCLSHGMCEQL